MHVELMELSRWGSVEVFLMKCIFLLTTCCNYYWGNCRPLTNSKDEVCPLFACVVSGGSDV